MPFSPIYLLLIVVGLFVLIAFVQIGLVTFAFDKLGLSSGSALLLLISSLIGSVINLPMFSLKAEPPKKPMINPFFGLLRPNPDHHERGWRPDPPVLFRLSHQ